MREIDPTEVAARFADHDVPFVRHHLDPATTERAWAHGRAVVADGTVSRWADAPPGPVRTCVGPAEDLAPLMASLAGTVAAPWRTTVEEHAYALLPASWVPPGPNRWHWMATRAAVGPAADAVLATRVHEVDDAVVERVLDAANPDSFARPGTHRVEAWLGVRDADAVVGGVGALVRQPDGTGHLRGVSVLPGRRGQGLGTLLSAALTRRALAGAGPRLATLGVYADNAPALAVYAGLGYAVVHTFRSGVCAAYATG